MTKILMVCMGNICRSPMAQVVTLRVAEQAGISRAMTVDSAGTHTGRISDPPDTRAKTVLAARGYRIGKIRSRQVTERDFDHYDLILAMDTANLNYLLHLCPAANTHKLKLFLEFANAVDDVELPDPYYGSIQGFERVLDLCEAGAHGLIKYVQAGLK